MSIVRLSEIAGEGCECRN